MGLIPCFAIPALALFGSALCGSAFADDGCRPVDIAPDIEIIPHETVLIVGELHGHQQGPQAVGDLACQLAGDGHDVAMLLEMSSSFTEPLSGLSGDRDHDLGIVCDDLAPFWGDGVELGRDGRSSRAIAELILRMGRLNAAGGSSVSVMGMDASNLEGGGWNRQRRDAMAQTAIRALDSHDVVLINVGNAHPTGIQMRVLESDPGLHAVRVLQVDTGGTAWNCTSGSCGEREWGPSRRAGDIELSPDLKIERTDAVVNYDAVFHIGPITASPPLVDTNMCGNQRSGLD